MNRLIHKDRVLGTITLIFGLVFLVGSLNLPGTNLQNDPGPKVFPILGAIIIIGSSLGIMLKKESQEKPFLTGEQWKKLWLLFLVFMGYAIGFWLIGYILSTIITLFIISSLFSVGKSISVLRRLLFSVFVTIVIYLAFTEILSLRLPSGMIFS